jgi:UDP-N-acetylglucosamine 3-dehydrogenase
MAQFQVGLIGCSRPRTARGRTRFGQGHIHAAGYAASPDCEIVAAADISRENLDLFCERFSVPHGYLEHQEMLAKEDLDIVSVCVWPALHAPMVIDAARAGVKAVHCEKPMAPTWGEAKRMAAVCEEHNVQLTINHQRRFGKPFGKAKELLDGGGIGDLTRVEAFTSNLYDWGTHWFDMMFFYNDEEPVEWVIGQVDARDERSIFGVRVEGQGLSLFKWRNGVYGLLVTGHGVLSREEGKVTMAKGMECGNRLIGTEGVIEVGVMDGPAIRLRNEETRGQWQDFDVGGGIHDVTHDNPAAIRDLAEALRTGREPVLSARKALQATELIFATYESSRKRGRVDLPLEIEDSPLLSMLESGAISAEP